MKQYKVGDTIYIKDTVKEIDHNPETYAKYSTLENNWIDNDTIIDELPVAEPVKPVLPKAVADELKEAKDDCGNFFSYLADSNEYPVTLSYAFAWGADDAKIKILSDAWYNGYTVEKEPTWYIKVPGKFVRPTYYAINDGSLAFGYLDEDKKWYHDYSAHAFTDEEIKKYDLENFHKELVADD